MHFQVQYLSMEREVLPLGLSLPFPLLCIPPQEPVLFSSFSLCPPVPTTSGKEFSQLSHSSLCADVTASQRDPPNVFLFISQSCLIYNTYGNKYGSLPFDYELFLFLFCFHTKIKLGKTILYPSESLYLEQCLAKSEISVHNC